MKRILFSIILVIFGGAFFTLSAKIAEKKLYPVYVTHYENRRLRPELFPPSYTYKLISVGHFTTYANLLWIGLIQFVGDNVGNNQYLEFSHHILKNITDLSPYFGKAYEMDLLFTPLVFADDQDVTTDDIAKIERAIQHGKEGMSLLCDTKKIETLSKLPYGEALWARQDIKNPCKYGMIPYYIAFHYSNDLGRNAEASYYYKIASVHDRGVPGAAKFLGPLALANTKDPLDAALSLLLIAREGYDKEPYICRTYSQSLFETLKERPILTEAFIQSVQDFESRLGNAKDAEILESYMNTNCYDNLTRAIKQVFLAYITQKSKDFPEITNGKVLIEQGIITNIPTVSSQPGYNVRKINGRWHFRTY